ncbi:response regulator transcription factor [Enterobacillus tribolii]|uniref:DNA-binding NarL/FixJ family response regulator n=1 Tax=Enterobacillus tribolii TaxID=1487935 RepID=A0A370QNY6_9GAMM|nr:LuxR C-terminal-related transcriptional regulator [Enterobacillus tribolii]MBW7981901.1 response regulator transcription factor [Enterobacillus tribolii]RDK90079.1 DNA-binding NarL/FixJ family response regulator [Enterobacillus tribolii]
MNNSGKKALSEKKAVRIIIGHACILTRRGLVQLFAGLLPQADILSVGSLLTAGIYPEIIMADLVVSDIGHDVVSSAAGTEQLLLLPQIREGKPLVMIAEGEHPALLMQLARFSNVSLISANASRQKLNAQLTEILDGKQVIEMMPAPAPAQQVAEKRREKLTASEQRVMALLRAGFSVTQIAGQLCRSVKTVSTHKRQIMRKLGVTSEVALFAQKYENH